FYGLVVKTETGKIVVTGQTDAYLHSRESEEAKLFDSREFHPKVREHAKELFLEKRYFHAVFECCKAFDKYVREKSKLDKHGLSLMSSALSLKGPLKLNPQRTETEKNEQEGLMHLCIGLMRAIRNPEGHEPELDWPITREDALDILSLISYLYRKIDKTVFYSNP
ncbi:MAG: TIGR02391 family protein, partial [candidate division WOR-3 bacterium]|nr:TIGR02391 family protein [candidate division WOR-3 bacterium]